jgi:hypothetical protein
LNDDLGSHFGHGFVCLFYKKKKPTCAWF